jgi:hypothetical protein
VTPPLRGRIVLQETRLPFTGVLSTERVLVAIDDTGSPVSVNVTQRLMLNGLGDYTFAVPGPVLDVAASPGSASEPGLRRGAILWSGFSPGHKTLAARARLRLEAAQPALPVRLTLARDGGALTLRVENISATPAALLIGPSSAVETADALDKTRRTARLRPALDELYVNVPRRPRTRDTRIAASLRVTGELRFPGGRRVPVNVVLGDGGANDFVLRVANDSGVPSVHLVVQPVVPSKLLTPPGGSKTWAEAVRRGRIDPSRLLEVASRARLTIARALDYETFLVNPDPHGTSRAVYVYETAAKPAPVTQPPQRHDRSGWTTLATAAILILGAGGLVVLWAHN